MGSVVMALLLPYVVLISSLSAWSRWLRVFAF